METKILDLDSGVEMWKITPSKSETVWSMLTGGALEGSSQFMNEHVWVQDLPRESFSEYRLNQHILIVDEQHFVCVSRRL